MTDQGNLADFYVVVPSKMNPVGEEGNMFSSLFDKVPAKRAGNDEDIAGVVLYLASRAGVRYSCHCTTISCNMLHANLSP